MLERVALIVGAASGIGAATARKLASRGVNIVLADLNRDNLHEKASALSTEFHIRTDVCQVDVSQEDQVKSMVEQAASLSGRIDYAANCAGICEAVWSEEKSISTDIFDRTFAVNARGVWLCQKFEAQKMQMQEPREPGIYPIPPAGWRVAGQRGAIANVASVSGLHAIGLAAYTPSKYAVVGITKNGAKFYGPSGIRCNALCPGWTMTELTQNNLGLEGTPGTKENEESPVNRRVALGRMSLPEEQANVMSFLLSDDSSYVNGALLVCDGGFHDIRS